MTLPPMLPSRPYTRHRAVGAVACTHKGYAYLIQRTSSAAEIIVPSPNCSLLYRDKLSLIWLRKGRLSVLIVTVCPACFIPNGCRQWCNNSPTATSFLDALSCCIAETCTTRMEGIVCGLAMRTLSLTCTLASDRLRACDGGSEVWYG